jgi:hypothetical protein
MANISLIKYSQCGKIKIRDNFIKDGPKKTLLRSCRACRIKACFIAFSVYIYANLSSPLNIN